MANTETSDTQMAEMALEDARKTLLDSGESGRVRLDAIKILRDIGMSFSRAVKSVDNVLFYGG